MEAIAPPSRHGNIEPRVESGVLVERNVVAERQHDVDDRHVVDRLHKGLVRRQGAALGQDVGLLAGEVLDEVERALGAHQQARHHDHEIDQDDEQQSHDGLLDRAVLLLAVADALVDHDVVVPLYHDTSSSSRWSTMVEIDFTRQREARARGTAAHVRAPQCVRHHGALVVPCAHTSRSSQSLRGTMA